jgi:hypothetical protein
MALHADEERVVTVFDGIDNCAVETRCRDTQTGLFKIVDESRIKPVAMIVVNARRDGQDFSKTGLRLHSAQLRTCPVLRQ